MPRTPNRTDDDRDAAQVPVESQPSPTTPGAGTNPFMNDQPMTRTVSARTVAQPTAPTETKPDYITVTAVGVETKRRANRNFTTTPTTLKTSDLTDAEYQAIKADGNLRVVAGSVLDIDAQRLEDAERSGLGEDINAWRQYADKLRRERDDARRQLADTRAQQELREATDRERLDRNAPGGRTGGF